MQNPFNHENYPSNDLKRNVFPCSFQTNLTMKYGYIYPAGIWRTVPGATYKIQPTLGLNFMPTTFPVQTRQKVYVHYFYGRDRNFWKDYKDFVNGQRPDLVKPYIDESVTMARTGNLLDYLGVPTTLVGDYGNVTESYTIDASDERSLLGIPDFIVQQQATAQTGLVQESVSSLFSNLYSSIDQSLTFGRLATPSLSSMSALPVTDYISRVDNTRINISFTLSDSPVDVASLPDESVAIGNTGSSSYVSPTPRDGAALYNFFKLILLDTDNILLDIIEPSVSDNSVSFYLNSSLFSSAYIVFPSKINYYYALESDGSYSNLQIKSKSPYSYDKLINVSYTPSLVRDIDDSNSPYWRSNDDRGKETIKLNAYLPRMYETIYNLYYRNPQNNPYMLNGLPEYNKFIPTKDGGVDSNLYELRRRNWEDDFLTTAVQSPQQGIAPLVGLTDRGATLTLTNDDGSVTRYNVSVDDNGSLTGVEATDTSAEPVLTRALIDAVSYGISIEDIRNVNAMQKWLELNLRKGYQYKDIIQARWGISISYNELDLPEFIGGFTKEVELQAVTQTANVNDDVTGQLGWQGGRLFASGNGREITHYCDEEGFIMCLVTTVPVPNYSQLLPKHWIERDLLDSYQPEFNHIGFQPITYKEVCPVQAYQESTENVNVLEQTFGYQRPWYQYFNYTDEVHGQFRTTFKDFLINRVFDVKPELSESFLLVDPEQINDVFNVTDPNDDKIIGAIYHNCVAKLPISLYAQARLE